MVRFVSFIGYLCLLLDEGKSALLALSLQRSDSSEEGKDMYFQQSSFYNCLFITVTNIVTQRNEDLAINYIMVFHCEVG